MKKPLRHCDITIGKRYEVVRTPKNWVMRYPYDNLNKSGVCKWVNVNYGICLSLDNSPERIVPPECLEEVPEVKPVIKDLNKSNVVIGNVYLVYKQPHFYDTAGYKCPVLGKFGKLKQVYGNGTLIVFGKDETQHFVPFDCLQEVIPQPKNDVAVEISDNLLIERMMDNPEGVLKIVKGLWKMTKDPSLRAIVEREVAI